MAFSFNLGFFSAVGLPFLSLFSVQDHIVFSLSGAFIVVTLFSALLSIASNISFYADQPKWSLPWIINGTGFMAALDFAILNSVHDEYVSYGVFEAAVLFILLAFAAIMVGVILAARGVKLRSQLLIGALLGTAFLSGVLYAGRQVDGEKIGHRGIALSKSDKTQYGLVRAGQLYTLIVSPDHIVHAVRTDDLLEMSWDGNGYRYRNGTGIAPLPSSRP